MNIQIITSSYPAFEGDPKGTAGLFVQSFANELVTQGHKVIVQPVARKNSYQVDPGIIIEPIPWEGGDQELASMNLINPLNWWTFLNFFLIGKRHTTAIHQKYDIDRILCMWIIPCGIFGYWINKKFQKKYDVWALGSDIWKIKKIPLLGKYWIKKIVRNATGVFADGIKLADDVKAISGRECQFLPSSRILPEPENDLTPLEPTDACHLLFVGRYHKNKGPDLLLKSLAKLSSEIKAKTCVHIFGTGQLENELKTLHHQLGLEHFVKLNGPIKAQEFTNYLKRVSFLLIPSRIESIPVVFSDALQRQVPVIAMPVGDLPALVDKFRCGILSQEVSVNSFAKAIEEGVKAGSTLYASGVKTALEHFKVPLSVEKWLN